MPFDISQLVLFSVLLYVRSGQSMAIDIMRTAYYIHSTLGDEINICCFICVCQRWALHVAIKWQPSLHLLPVKNILQ